MIEGQEVVTVVNGWELFPIGIGLVFQLVGAIVTFSGIRAGWRTVARENETFRQFLLEQLRTTSRNIFDVARRLIGNTRGRNEHVLLTDQAAISDSIHVALTYSKLSPDMATGEAILELENRINRLRTDLNNTANVLRDEREERRASLETLRSDITGELTSRAEEERQRSVRALRSEIAGFWFITFGFVLQGVGSIIGALS